MPWLPVQKLEIENGRLLMHIICWNSQHFIEQKLPHKECHLPEFLWAIVTHPATSGRARHWIWTPRPHLAPSSSPIWSYLHHWRNHLRWLWDGHQPGSGPSSPCCGSWASGGSVGRVWDHSLGTGEPGFDTIWLFLLVEYVKVASSKKSNANDTQQDLTRKKSNDPNKSQ